MFSRICLLGSFFFISACEGPSGSSGVEVSLAIADTTQVGSNLAVSVSITGCSAVSSISLFDAEAFIKRATWAQNPTEVSISASELQGRFSAKGIAAELALTANVKCSDGRSGVSPALSVRFMPVDRALSSPGEQLLPNAFSAEGGVGSEKTTFLGCIGTGGTVGVGRIDTNGKVETSNTQLPFTCSSQASFTERNASYKIRWMMEPNTGAIALNDALEVTGHVTGPVQALHQGFDADAIVVANGLVQRVRYLGGAVAWTFAPSGQLLTVPVVGSFSGKVSVPVMSFIPQTGKVIIGVETVRYDTGATLNQTEIFSFTGSVPQLGAVALNEFGSVIYIAYKNSVDPNSNSHSVVACNAESAGCTSTNLKWQSPSVPAPILALVPYHSGAQIAAITANSIYFLNDSNGKFNNWLDRPITPSGFNQWVGVLPGKGSDFYALSATPGGFATEIVGVDSPQAGELLRFNMNGGQTIQNSLTAAVDDAGTLWLRVGMKHVKAMPMATYRLWRGPTP